MQKNGALKPAMCTVPSYHWWSVLVLHLFSYCLIITLLNFLRKTAKIKSKDGVISAPRRVAHLILYVRNRERFYDLGNASLGPSHTGADEAAEGD